MSDGKAVPGSRAMAQADYEALALFRYELRRFLAFSEAAARGAGLTAQQHQALLAIKGAPSEVLVSVGFVAERLLIRHHSAVELVDRLCAAGLLHRQPDPNDRRRVLLSLTPAATALLERLSSDHLAELQRLRPNLTAILGAFDDRRDTAAGEAS